MVYKATVSANADSSDIEYPLDLNVSPSLALFDPDDLAELDDLSESGPLYLHDLLGLDGDSAELD